MDLSYQDLTISLQEAESIAAQCFNISGLASPLAGEIDFNFKIKSREKKYILKISRPNVELNYLEFQDALLRHIDQKKPDFVYPKIVQDEANLTIKDYVDKNGVLRKIRMIEWIDGDLYSSVNYKNDALRHSLGQRSGELVQAFFDFDHAKSVRTFEWDIANGLWVKNYLHLFTASERKLVDHFIQMFESIQMEYNNLRKSTIHNDANDNNVLVESDLYQSKCLALIDYGDAVYSQLINELAVTLAYAMMNCRQPLQAAVPIVKGFHEKLPLQDEELKLLYVCTAMRLIISVTKSAINKIKEPDNTYLTISEKSAWELLAKWSSIPHAFAYYTFRESCGLEACPYHLSFKSYASNQQWSIENLMPSINFKNGVHFQKLNLSIASNFIGNFHNYKDMDYLNQKIEKKCFDDNILCLGGYGEARPIYTTDAYRIPQNDGYEYRTVHMGVDFWTNAYADVAALEQGEILSVYNNDNDKDYGPTIILKHTIEALTFYTLYGHLSIQSLEGKKIGQKIKKNEVIGQIGSAKENGNWAPHLHFQIILDLLDCKHDFYGVSLPSQWPIYKSICPDPNLLFGLEILSSDDQKSLNDLLTFRKKHLGKSLSIAYTKPIKIVRGEMQYLIDEHGQKYLDTVNNVAHVGHEHPVVVNSGSEQMNVLNTNTRYIHDGILEYAEMLLKKFPPDLCVVHFVNSGSEANELALRMARAYTGQQDVIALEIGYHGNTQACIDISSYKFDGKGGQGCPEHTQIVPLPDAFRGLHRGENTGPKYAAYVSDAIAKIHNKGKNISAFIAESIVSCGGQVVLPVGYLKEAYAHVRSAGGLCIADEVQVGFGRVGHSFWGFELHGVVPDIVTCGKPIGNGHPLAAVVCTQAVANAFANGMEFFNTFGGNPVSCSIGKSVLQVIENEDLQRHALTVGTLLKQKLKSLAETYPVIGDVRGEGLFLGVEFVNELLEPLTAETSFIADRMKDHQVLMSVDGPYNNVLKIKPPLCFNIENADYTILCLEKILKELQ